jgi:hypothetical protein
MADTKAEAPATLSMMPRWTAMLNEDCLNVRLGDYFHQRREAASDMQTCAAEPDDNAAPDAALEQGAE